MQIGGYQALSLILLILIIILRKREKGIKNRTESKQFKFIDLYPTISINRNYSTTQPS